MKVIVVAGGDAVARDADLLAEADLVIAADAGAHWLEDQGRLPDRVVGDMDSVRPALLARLAARGVVLERYAVDKDASDLELAIRSAVHAGADQIVILGAAGGVRLDHEIANLLLLAEPAWRGIDLRLKRDRASARAVRGPGHLRLEGRIGDLVTLLSLGDAAIGVRTEGLRWRLAGETLGIGSTRGLSNAVALAPASVSLESGTLLVIETEQEVSE